MSGRGEVMCWERDCCRAYCDVVLESAPHLLAAELVPHSSEPMKKKKKREEESADFSKPVFFRSGVSRHV